MTRGAVNVSVVRKSNVLKVVTVLVRVVPGVFVVVSTGPGKGVSRPSVGVPYGGDSSLSSCIRLVTRGKSPDSKSKMTFENG